MQFADESLSLPAATTATITTVTITTVTIAATTAAITTTATIAAAAVSTATIFFRTGFVNFQITAVNFSAIQRFNRLFCPGVVHFYKAKTTEATCFAIRNVLHRLNLTKLGEQFVYVVLSG